MHLASTGPAPIPELAAALNDLSPRLQWKRRNSSSPDGTSFHDGHANALSRGQAASKSAKMSGSASACWRPMCATPTTGIIRKRFTSRWPAAPGGMQTWTGPRRARAASSTTSPTCSTPCEPKRSRCSPSGACGWTQGDDCSMSAGLKFLMILFWVVAFSAVATAQSAEEDDLQTMYKKMFGGIEVSCETLLDSRIRRR